MASTKHIVVLTPGFPKDIADDVCLPYFQDFLRAFQAARPDIYFTIISFQYPFHKNPYMWERIRVYPMGGANRKLKKLLVWRDAKRTFNKIRKARPVDAIMSLWLNDTSVVAAELAEEYRVSHIALLMGQDVLPDNHYLKSLNLNKIKIVALSNRLSENLFQVTGHRADTLIRFAEPIPATPPEMLPWDQRPIDILGVGSLIPLKKYDRFLHVIRQLADVHPNLKAVLIGDGTEKKHLMELAKQIHLEDHVQILGLQTRKSTLEWMGRSKVLLHPSSYEGQGYVFTEALNRGMYIVSSDCGEAQASEDWIVCTDTIRMAASVEQFWGAKAPDLTLRRQAWEKSTNEMVEGYLKLFGV